MLSIALLLSLCFMGIGYSAWTDTIDIYGTVGTASWLGVLTEPAAVSQNISLNVATPDTLNVNVNDAQAGTQYTGSFKVSNIGTVPIKIDSIVLGLPPDTTATISGVSVGDQIDPGETKSAGVSTNTSIEGKSYNFTATFTFALWNE